MSKYLDLNQQNLRHRNVLNNNNNHNKTVVSHRPNVVTDSAIELLAVRQH